MAARGFDVVLWGCTGFTGRLVAEYFATSVTRRYPKLKWALAGRSADKVKEVKAQAKDAARAEGLDCDPAVLLGAADDQASVDAIVSQARVLVSTAGPFLKYGTPVVDACVRLGCDYVDTTGETPWVRSIMDRYDDSARDKKVIVVPMCGFDSIPADLGALFTARLLWALHRQKTRRITSYVKMRGAMSGGTVASSQGMDATAKANPFLFGGVRADGVRLEDRDVEEAAYAEEMKAWTAPFMMAQLNTRVVRRSNQLLEETGNGYGRDFAYKECGLAKDENEAKKSALSAKAPPEVLQRLVEAGRLPKPGEGPSKEERAKSFFQYTLVGHGEGGAMVKASVRGGDPGYTETAKMVSEAALCLALQKEVLIPARQGGVLTPAAAFGHVLIANLHAAGIRFSVDGSDAGKKAKL